MCTFLVFPGKISQLTSFSLCRVQVGFGYGVGFGVWECCGQLIVYLDTNIFYTSVVRICFSGIGVLTGAALCLPSSSIYCLANRLAQISRLCVQTHVCNMPPYKVYSL